MAKYSPTTYAFLIGLRTGGMSFQEISKRMNIPLRTIHDIYRRIVERGFDHEKDPLHFDEAYLETRKASDKDATPKKGKATKKVSETVLWL